MVRLLASFLVGTSVYVLWALIIGKVDVKSYILGLIVLSIVRVISIK